MVLDEQKDAHTENPKPICPVNFFEVGGIKKNYLLSEMYHILEQFVPEKHN